MKFFKNYFKRELIEIDPPMDILRFPLSDYSQSGKEKYVSVYSKDYGGYAKHPISTGVNPMSNRSLIYNSVKEVCYGDILDVGACVGDLSLQLQNYGMSVTAIDVSEHAVKFMKGIGIRNCFQRDIREPSNDKYDTILFMGSTIGICGRIEELPLFLDKIKSMLRRGGQLIIEDHHMIGPKGYNEFTTHLKYKRYISTEFNWFNIGQDKLLELLRSKGYETKLIFDHKYMSNYVVGASPKVEDKFCD